MKSQAYGSTYVRELGTIGDTILMLPSASSGSILPVVADRFWPVSASLHRQQWVECGRSLLGHALIKPHGSGCSMQMPGEVGEITQPIQADCFRAGCTRPTRLRVRITHDLECVAPPGSAWASGKVYRMVQITRMLA
ncbi:MAG: hypothetical protein ACREXR_00705 [Gammaproteobacteria bacterium]